MMARWSSLQTHQTTLALIYKANATFPPANSPDAHCVFQTKKLLLIYINYRFLMHKGEKKKLEKFLHSCRESINKL